MQSGRRAVISPLLRSSSSFSSSASKRGGRATKRDYKRLFQRKDILKSFAEVNRDHEARAAAEDLGWDLAAATVVERTPVVTPELPAWERDFLELQQKLAYYDVHDWPEGLGPPHPSTHTREEIDPPFELAPRVTAADDAEDTTSLERALPEVRTPACHAALFRAVPPKFYDARSPAPSPPVSPPAEPAPAL